MFRKKNGNTRVDSIERKYGVDLNARGDAVLKNVLRRRGFDSQSQLINAAKGNASTHARRRRCFISFHAEDRPQANGLRLMAMNPNVELDFHDGSVRAAIQSDEAAYVKQVIAQKIAASSVVICLVGNGTAWREWVDWELETAFDLGKGVIAIRIPGTYGRKPAVLATQGTPLLPWNVDEIIAAIEQAAALRS